SDARSRIAFAACGRTGPITESGGARRTGRRTSKRSSPGTRSRAIATARRGCGPPPQPSASNARGHAPSPAGAAAPGASPARRTPRALATRWRTLERIAQDLNHNEDDAGLSETRSPDPGFVPYAYDWVAGEDLADVLGDDTELTGGDFVRHVKQCIDLLRQIGDVAPKPETATTARAAADACFRGVIATSSAVGR